MIQIPSTGSLPLRLKHGKIGMIDLSVTVEVRGMYGKSTAEKEGHAEKRYDQSLAFQDLLDLFHLS